MQTAKKNKTMPDFAAVKELVEQHVDSYRCSRVSLVQALTIDAYSTSGCGLSNLDFIAHARGVVIKSQVWCVATEIEFVRAGRAGEL